MFRDRSTESTFPRAHNTEVQLPLMEPAQIPPVSSHSASSFLGGLCTLTALLTVLELLAAWLAAHQVQIINYLYTT